MEAVHAAQALKTDLSLCSTTCQLSANNTS